MIEDIQKYFQILVDKTKPKLIDKISVVLMVLMFVFSIYLLGDFLAIVHTPIIRVHSLLLYTIIFIVSESLFYFTMLGDKTNKPVNRPKIYLYTVCILTIITYCLLGEIFNYSITTLIGHILKTNEVPNFLIHTNVRLFTVFLPLLIVVVVFSKSYAVFFNKEYRQQLLEYQVDPLTRNIYKMDDTTLNIKICENIETGRDVKVCEQVSVRHTLIDGSSGSGKTALNIRPSLAQIFYKKAFYREKLKELTYQALDKGLCYINKPITNKFLNENFSMEYISVYEDKKKEFIELFKDYIVGVRKNHSKKFNETKAGNSEKIVFEIPFKIHKDITKNKLICRTYINDMIENEFSEEFVTQINKVINKKDFDICFKNKSYTKEVQKIIGQNDNGEPVYGTETEFAPKDFGDGNIFEQYIEVTINIAADKLNRYSFNICLDEYTESKIIYKDLGVAVIAPDGGLAKDTFEIAKENGIRVHKIDPKKEEISKGDVACINPLLVGSPEKAGDIVSSILVAMENSSGKDSNPYFTNASIRAVRNVIILLKVMYPRLNDNANPILTDALEMLNNFSLVMPYVTAMKEDEYLSVRWKSVIDYFETCFYPPALDEKGKPIAGSNIGRNTKKTEEAIGGIVNQLDNFLGREEIKYVFCNREKSLNLSEVLEKGECIAISTRQSELGDVLGKAFALMNILSIQNAVLGRYSEDENPEIIYHIIIDEFPFYINDQTKVFFTFARKYKCPTTVAIQNLAQLEDISKVFREVVFTNCATKIVLPGANVEDRKYFCDYFGIEEKFEVTTSVTTNPVITENPKYSESARGTLKDANKVTTQELAELKFKRCYYSTVDSKGRNIVGKGYMDFLKLTENNTIKPKEYNFERFNKVSIYESKSNEELDNSKTLKRIKDEFKEVTMGDIELQNRQLKDELENKLFVNNIEDIKEKTEEVNESNNLDNSDSDNNAIYKNTENVTEKSDTVPNQKLDFDNIEVENMSEFIGEEIEILKVKGKEQNS